MKVFISWSKERSHTYAVALHQWIREVIQQVEPWISTEDISKGQRWSTQLFEALDSTSHGIICITRENMAEPWLNFEAGALAKSLSQGQIRPLLVDLTISDFVGPLSLFQATVATDDEDMMKLIESINASCQNPLDKARLERAFVRTFPDFAKRARDALSATPLQPDDEASVRQTGEVLEEVLERVREIQRTLNEGQSRSPHVGSVRPPRPTESTESAGAATISTEEALTLLREKLAGIAEVP